MKISKQAYKGFTKARSHNLAPGDQIYMTATYLKQHHPELAIVKSMSTYSTYGTERRDYYIQFLDYDSEYCGKRMWFSSRELGVTWFMWKQNNYDYHNEQEMRNFYEFKGC